MWNLNLLKANVMDGLLQIISSGGAVYTWKIHSSPATEQQQLHQAATLSIFCLIVVFVIVTNVTIKLMQVARQYKQFEKPFTNVFTDHHAPTHLQSAYIALVLQTNPQDTLLIAQLYLLHQRVREPIHIRPPYWPQLWNVHLFTGCHFLRCIGVTVSLLPHLQD